jgi:hypothetical protein
MLPVRLIRGVAEGQQQVVDRRADDNRKRKFCHPPEHLLLSLHPIRVRRVPQAVYTIKIASNVHCVVEFDIAGYIQGTNLPELLHDRSSEDLRVNYYNDHPSRPRKGS